MKVLVNFVNENGETIRSQTMSIREANKLIRMYDQEDVFPNFDGGWDIFVKEEANV